LTSTRLYEILLPKLIYALSPQDKKDAAVIYEIKNRFTGSITFSQETNSIKLCVEAAFRAGANLSGADLSGSRGLLDPSEWLNQFDHDDLGIIVFKRLGSGNTHYPPPAHWQEQIGAILTEVVNPDRGTDCGSGVNFGTLEWCQNNYAESHLWKCRIAWIDLAGVVVPLNTDGKARCGRLELLELVE